MKARVVLTSLLFVVASAHPVHDPRLRRDLTLHYYPTLRQEATLRHDLPVDQDLTLEYDPRTLWQDPELVQDFRLEVDPTPLDRNPRPIREYTPVLLVKLDPSLVRKLLQLRHDLSQKTYRRNRLVGSGQKYIIHDRRKRQVNVTGGIERSILDYGGVRNTATINVGRTFNKHTYTGGITYDTTTYPGLKPIRNVGANIGYEYKPNESTSLSAGIEHIRGSGDKSTNFNVRLVHILGKKKRRRENIPKEDDE